ncbi:MAG TPA: septum formation initiator family protein [Actinomycetota bacterium]|nr:septum formation initiator family protein [Actinomycetota bacterium]
MGARRPAHARPSVRVTARAAVLFVTVLIVLAFGMAPLQAYLEGRSEIAELQRQAAILEQATDHLDRRIAELNDPTELERIARECLVMVKPGETAFVMVPEDSGPPAADC